MKKLVLAALPLAFAITACDSPTEKAAKEVDDVVQAEQDLAKEKAEAAEAIGEATDKAENAMADESAAAADLEANAEAMGEAADKMEAAN